MNSEECLLKLSELLLLEYPKYFKTKLDFAAAVDVDEKTIRNILKGQQNITLKILIQLGEALKLQPSEILKAIGI